jgi:hypothetical protein
MNFLRFFIIFLLLTGSVTALGVYEPNTKEFFFKPGLKVDIPFGFYHPKPFKVEVNAGELAPYFSFPDREMESGLHYIDLRMELPEELPRGVFKIEVTAQEISQVRGQVSAFGTVVVPLRVINPYEGKHPEYDLQIRNGVFGESHQITVEVRNYGDQHVDKVVADVQIYSEDTLVHFMTSDPQSVLSLQTEQIRQSWVPSTGESGKYQARITMTADGEVEEVISDFTLGKENVVILDHTQTLFRGVVNEFILDLKSEWIKDYESKARVTVDLGGPKAAGENPVLLLPPLVESQHSVFFSIPNGAPLGSTTATVRITLPDGKSYKDEDVTVKIEDPPFNYVEPEVQAPGGDSIWVVAVIVLLLIIIVFLATRLRKGSLPPASVTPIVPVARKKERITEEDDEYE